MLQGIRSLRIEGHQAHDLVVWVQFPPLILYKVYKGYYSEWLASIAILILIVYGVYQSTLKTYYSQRNTIHKTNELQIHTLCSQRKARTGGIHATGKKNTHACLE